MGKREDKAVVCESVEGPVTRHMRAQDWAWVAGWLCGRFGVDVDAAWVAGNAAKPGHQFRDGWSDGSWAMWWKNRLYEVGHFQAGGRTPREVHCHTTLHVFFPHLEETDEMLAALRCDGRYDPAGAPRLGTPGIARTLHFPDPINRTAALVVHRPHN